MLTITRLSKSLKESPSSLPEHTPTGSPHAGAAGSVAGVQAGSPECAREQVQQAKDRHASKSKELAAWFGIPEGEALVADFHCALRKRVLLQGRLFVFEHYICFHSNVFGFTEKKAIALADVESVCKKTYFKFPNSIELQDSSGQRDFFTSFLTRESAFRTIVAAWSRVRPELAESLLPTQATTTPEDEVGPLNYRKTTSSVMHMLTGGGSIFFWDGKKKKDPTLPEDPDAAQEDQDSSGNCLPAAAEGEGDGTVHEGHMMPRGLSLSDLDGKADDEAHDESSEAMWESVSAEPEPVPCHKDSRLLMSTQLPGTLRDFFDLIIANDGPFYEDVLVELGNRKIDISAWKAAEQLGHVRDVQFVAPIKGAFSSWGVPTTRCFVTQRFCRYPNQHLLFETSQTNLDIPYGDYFTVDMRWDVRTDPSSSSDDPRVLLELHIRTPFSRTCLFKKIIESGVYSQAKDNYACILAQASLALRRRVASRQQQQHAQAAASQPGSAPQIRMSLSGRRAVAVTSLDLGTSGDVAGAGQDVCTTPTPASRASGRRVGSATALPSLGAGMVGASTPVAVGASALFAPASARGGGPGRGAGRAWSWLGPLRGLLLVLLLLLMCAVQLYMLLLLQPGAGAALPAWLKEWAALPPPQQQLGGSCSIASHAGAPFHADSPWHAGVGAASQGGGTLHGAGPDGQPPQQDAGALLQRLQLLQGELAALQQRADAATAEVSCLLKALAGCSAPAAS